jgi:hypothetical protein
VPLVFVSVLLSFAQFLLANPEQVFGGSYALVPLMMSKSAMPAWMYVGLLLVIHIGVLIVYCWRVKFRSLDVDRVSLGARVLGLAVVTWLLSAVSG